MRIAWLGLSPTEDVGTSYLATQLLVELVRLGVDCEVFCAAAETSIHPRLRASEDLRLFCLPSGWQPDRWYNRTPLSHHLSLTFARIRAPVVADRAVRPPPSEASAAADRAAPQRARRRRASMASARAVPGPER